MGAKSCRIGAIWTATDAVLRLSRIFPGICGQNLQIFRTPLKEQYGKPLLNGLIPQCRQRGDQGAIQAPPPTAAFLQQFHSEMRQTPHVAWKRRSNIVYLWNRN
jgi:hypothetical protein